MKELLVVVDMQKDFVDGALGTKEAQGIVENVVKKVKKQRNVEKILFSPWILITRITFSPRREEIFRWLIALRELRDGS